MKHVCQRGLWFLFFLSFSIFLYATNIQGKVTDAVTGEPLVGAVVTLEGGGKTITTVVRLDGSYNFKNLPAGNYTIKVSNTGYEEPPPVTLDITSPGKSQVSNFSLKTKVTEMTGVQVVSNGKASDARVRSLEKNSSFLQNILSEKTIQLLPDVTVANALQRVSGVSIQRSSTGEGRYAIIRGMDERYNN